MHLNHSSCSPCSYVSSVFLSVRLRPPERPGHLVGALPRYSCFSLASCSPWAPRLSIMASPSWAFFQVLQATGESAKISLGQSLFLCDYRLLNLTDGCLLGHLAQGRLQGITQDPFVREVNPLTSRPSGPLYATANKVNVC